MKNPNVTQHPPARKQYVEVYTSSGYFRIAFKNVGNLNALQQVQLAVKAIQSFNHTSVHRLPKCN